MAPNFPKTYFFWPLALFIALWCLINFHPGIGVIIFALRIPFYSGYLLILSVVGLGIDARVGNVPRIFQYISIAALSAGLVSYYSLYFEQQREIAHVEKILQEQNADQIQLAQEKLGPNIHSHSVLTSYFRDLIDNYKIPVAYLRLMDSEDSKFQAAFLLSSEDCSKIDLQSPQIIKMEFTSTAASRKLEGESRKLCILCVKADPKEPLLRIETTSKEEHSFKALPDVRIMKHRLLTDDKVVAEYQTAYIHGYSIIPWPIAFCGDFGGFLKERPKYWCRIDFRAPTSRELETRPQTFVDRGIEHPLAILLGLEPYSPADFENFQLTGDVRDILSTLSRSSP